ncbi:transcription activator MSS11-like [Solanum lycopersicum]|uniref:transcription activator MSS11-like n=1 Tax=Solanum lycopersicum TaxID=4081 RepID=UPI003748550C
MDGGKISKEKGDGKAQEQGKNAKDETTKTFNQPNKMQKEGQKKSEEQNQSKEHVTNQQQRHEMQKQDDQIQQEEQQGEQWQTQKKRNHKNQEHASSKSVWRPVTLFMHHTNNSQQQEQGITGNNIISTQNNFCSLEMQEKQEAQHIVQQGTRETASQEDHTKNDQLKDQLAENKQNNLQIPKLKAAAGNKCKESGIDLSLPSPRTPNDFNVMAGHTEEVYGGMDGGSKEKTTNLQDGVTKGGNLPHAMHEGLDHDHRTDLRAFRNQEHDLKQQKQQSQQQNQNTGNWKQPANENKGQQQHRNKEGEEQGKQGDNKDMGNTP